MSLVREFYMRRRDGVELYRTYSDAGMYIERDGIMYEEAIDPDVTDDERIYHETEIPIPVIEEEPEEALPFEPENEDDPTEDKGEGE